MSTAFAIGLVAFALNAAAMALAANPCEHALLVFADPGSNGYRQRGDRCEGLYLRPAAGEGTFQILSLTVGRHSSSLSHQAITLQWTAAPVRALVHLTAHPLRPRIYYQMDTLQPSSVGSYRWPLEVPDAIQLDAADIGITARTILAIGGVAHNVYIPVRIAEDFGGLSAPTLTIEAGSEMAEVYVTLERVDDKRQIRRVMRRKKALGYTLYARQTGIDIALPELRNKGLYALAIDGDIRDGGVVATHEFWVAVR